MHERGSYRRATTGLLTPRELRVRAAVQLWTSVWLRLVWTAGSTALVATWIAELLGA